MWGLFVVSRIVYGCEGCEGSVGVVWGCVRVVKVVLAFVIRTDTHEIRRLYPVGPAAVVVSEETCAC